jgi:hypothetical protein
MKQPPNKFSKGGFTFTLERRSEHAAIYKQQWNGKADASIAYEVVRPIISTKQFIDGQWRDSEPHEVYPSTVSWGVSGWTFTTLDHALAKYGLRLVQRIHRNRFDAPDGSGQPKKRTRRLSR